MRKFVTLVAIVLTLLLASCSSVTLPPFSAQNWHIDKYSGHAVSNDGMDLAFGSEWLVTDTTLIQNDECFTRYPALRPYLNDALGLFPEISVDSILFYNPHRGLVFALYHQEKPMKPVTQIFDNKNQDNCDWLRQYNSVYGTVESYIEDGEWESGPVMSVFTNLRYNRHKKLVVQLQRVPYCGQDLAIFSIYRTRPKNFRREDFPGYPFWNRDLGDFENFEVIGNVLHNGRTHAIENLRLGRRKR